MSDEETIGASPSVTATLVQLIAILEDVLPIAAAKYARAEEALESAKAQLAYLRQQEESSR